MKVIIYHMTNEPKRISCIETELKILRKYADMQGWEIVNEYVDMTSTISKKKELDKVISYEGEYDIVLVKYAYYVARNTDSFFKIRRQLQNKGVRIYGINEGWC